MRLRLRTFIAFTALVVVLVQLPAHGTALTPPPLVVTASTGPAAGAHVLATVTRTIGNARVTLPAALVPALQPGDTVDLDFPDYRRPPVRVNYHVNAAFITEVAPQHWLFEHSGPADQLFASSRHAKKTSSPALYGRIHFVYGSGAERGIPIFFIIPEDAKTRGVDGVRDYVDAHPTDFVDMSQSTNAAVDRYSFLSDFLTSLGTGSIDPATSQQRIETVAQGLGVSPATIDACYTTGGSSAVVDACVQQTIDGVVYQPDFAAPTQAQFLGGIAGAASPVTFAPYIVSLLTVWRLFVHTGHQEYEYLPTTLTLADPTTARGDELLMGLKVPTIRPPAAVSDVLFFTIGDPKAAESAPLVVNTAPAAGMCARTERFSLPLHFDHTSRYVHDAAVVATPDGAAQERLPLDPRTLSAPVIDRSRLPASSDGAYTVRLDARFGFDPIAQPAPATMRLAVPGAAKWTLAPLAHHPAVAGGTLDVVASSAAAPCLSRAEVQIGSAEPVALTATHLDAHRVELRAPLANVPAGPAAVRLYEDDTRSGRDIESDAALMVEAPAPHVATTPATAALGDNFLDLAGTGFERVRSVLADGATYKKDDATATAIAACFAGPVLGVRDPLTIGEQISAQLVTSDGAPGQIFPLDIAPARPLLASATVAPPATGPRPATDQLTILLQTPGAALPQQIGARLRKAPANAPAPCSAARTDPTAVTVPAADVHVRGSNSAAVEVRADLLGDQGFGTLEIQIVDAASKLASRWLPLPGTFARAPAVAQIACPADATAPCRLYGTELSAIDAVKDASGAFIAPQAGCPPTDKGVACVYVPHVAHFELRLVDGAITEALPDGLMVAVPH
jgi:hypothetical protein